MQCNQTRQKPGVRLGWLIFHLANAGPPAGSAPCASGRQRPTAESIPQLFPHPMLPRGPARTMANCSHCLCRPQYWTGKGSPTTTSVPGTETIPAQRSSSYATQTLPAETVWRQIHLGKSSAAPASSEHRAVSHLSLANAFRMLGRAGCGESVRPDLWGLPVVDSGAIRAGDSVAIARLEATEQFTFPLYFSVVL